VYSFPTFTSMIFGSMSLSYFVSLALATLAIAAPPPPFFPPPAGSRPGPPGSPPSFVVGLPGPPLARPPPGKKVCDLSAARLVFPSTITTLAVQSGPPSSLAIGVGFQNYTCSAAGNYTSAGAVADLYDLSCLSSNASAFDAVADIAYGAWKACPASIKTLGPTGAGSYPMLGSHYFIPNPSGTGLSPVWDYRAIIAKGNLDAFVLAAKVTNTPAPTGPQDVDWLQLKSVSGQLATAIYRTDTRGGQPPSSCTPGSAPISVKYVSKYWLFGGSVTI